MKENKSLFKEDMPLIDKIYYSALSDKTSYFQLQHLCKNYGGRICGSAQADGAVNYMYDIMQLMPFSSVLLQETQVASWNRGKQEIGNIISERHGKVPIEISALGGSISTQENGMIAEVIEFEDISQLQNALESEITGKVVFLNKPFNPSHFDTFRSYAEVAENRVFGAIEAAKKNAAGLIVRSLTHASDSYPHTGIMKYHNDVKQIPAFALCTQHADMLSDMLQADNSIKLHLESYCSTSADKKSFNVIGEIRGSEFPQRIITICGHLDSWDICEGAHDDGVGCFQVLETLRLFSLLSIKPRNTIRIVMMMDEEMNQRGGNTYADTKIQSDEQHYFALESDRGGFTPYGFVLDADEIFFKSVEKWYVLLHKYGIHYLEKGYSGVDIHPLKKYNIPLAGLITDTQRYFDYQHAASDRFENINHREMQLGSAAIASFVYFIDKYGYEISPL